MEEDIERAEERENRRERRWGREIEREEMTKRERSFDI
jgi:hypothetical protein